MTTATDTRGTWHHVDFRETARRYRAAGRKASARGASVTVDGVRLSAGARREDDYTLTGVGAVPFREALRALRERLAQDG